MLHLRGYEGVLGMGDFVTLTFKWRSITVKRQWLCLAQGRVTYTAEPELWMQGWCWSGVTWAIRLSRVDSTSVGMWDWNFSSCSGLARFFSREFSLSSWLFFSASSLICSLRTSTSSRTAYIRWFLTRSCNFKKTTTRKWISLDRESADAYVKIIIKWFCLFDGMDLKCRCYNFDSRAFSRIMCCTNVVSLSFCFGIPALVVTWTKHTGACEQGLPWAFMKCWFCAELIGGETAWGGGQCVWAWCLLLVFWAYHRLFNLVVDGHNASTRGTAEDEKKRP